MQQNRRLEIWVGIFMLVGLAALVFLGLKVADIKALGSEPTYRLTATFDNIGSLKPRSPVKIGGVVIGRVTAISLNTSSYLPQVELSILAKYNDIPETSSLSIRTSGLLGEQSLSLTPGFIDTDTAILKDGDKIEDTKSAMVLEDLIGQFLYNTGGSNNTTNAAESSAGAH
ncbi:MAG: outer membrane lipid asymmetry maintenance protein MlaD [Plesiomonas sp.]